MNLNGESRHQSWGSIYLNWFRTLLGEGFRCVGTGDAVTGVADMREINIRLWRNDELRDWSIEINGRFHEHVLDDGLNDLVDAALIIAAKSLIQSSVNIERSKVAEVTASG